MWRTPVRFSKSEADRAAGILLSCELLVLRTSHLLVGNRRQTPPDGTESRSRPDVLQSFHTSCSWTCEAVPCFWHSNKEWAYRVCQTARSAATFTMLICTEWSGQLTGVPELLQKDDDADFDTWIVESVGIKSLRLEMRFNLSFQFQVSYQPPQNLKTRQNSGTSRGNVDTRAPLAVSWFSHPWASKLTSGDETSAFDDDQYTHKHAMPGITKTSPSWMVQFIGIYDILCQLNIFQAN